MVAAGGGTAGGSRRRHGRPGRDSRSADVLADAGAVAGGWITTARRPALPAEGEAKQARGEGSEAGSHPPGGAAKTRVLRGKVAVEMMLQRLETKHQENEELNFAMVEPVQAFKYLLTPVQNESLSTIVKHILSTTVVASNNLSQKATSTAYDSFGMSRQTW